MCGRMFTVELIVNFYSHLMFNTGDLGKWNMSGMLEFYGRQDDQVKIKVRLHSRRPPTTWLSEPDWPLFTSINYLSNNRCFHFMLQY